MRTLVGFWYDREAAMLLFQKSVVVNRVGDFGLLLGILWVFTGRRVALSFEVMGDASGLLFNPAQLTDSGTVLFCDP